jgi:5-methyltetrahydropteroyltriglutamate--homocysteine methyltransferase
MLHVQIFGFRVNRALPRFPPEERRRIGIHTSSGRELDSTHGLDVDYAVYPPGLFELKMRSSTSCLWMSRKARKSLRAIRKHLKPDQ